MDSNVRALIAKIWKNESVDLEPGTHYVDDVLTIHVAGTVTKQSDQMVAPTVSIRASFDNHTLAGYNRSLP